MSKIVGVSGLKFESRGSAGQCFFFQTETLGPSSCFNRHKCFKRQSVEFKALG